MSTGLGHLTLPEIEDADVQEPIDEVEDFKDDDFDLEPDTGAQADDETESPDESGENWEARFKGLQSQHQEAIEGLRNMQSAYQQQQAQQQMMAQNFQQQLFRQQIADLEPEEQRAAIQRFEQQLQAQRQAQVLQQREQQLAQAFQFVDRYGQKIAAHEIASRYQVPAENLMKFDSPEEMMEAAKLAKSRRAERTQRTKRNRRRGGQFEGGTAPGRPKQPKKAASLAEAKAAFAQLDVPGQQR